MNIAELDWYRKEWQRDECACGETKERRSAFCRRCRRHVPDELAMVLERSTVDDKYAVAYEEAAKVLSEFGVL